MKDVVFFCYPKCSTCQKAKKWLEENSIKFQERDIVKNNPTKEELEKIYKKSKKELKKFFNTSGVLYRKMELKDKLAKMTEDEMLELLSSDGKLVKRPMLVTENVVLNGFKEEEWKDLLKGEK